MPNKTNLGYVVHLVDDSDDDGNEDVNMRIPSSNENFPANQYRSDDA